MYQNKNIYPNDLEDRLKYIIFELERRENAFPMTILLLNQDMMYFSGVIDVERCNGMNKWMTPPQRNALKTEKLEKILRIYYNSPDVEEKEASQAWMIEVAKLWNSKNKGIIIVRN